MKIIVVSFFLCIFGCTPFLAENSLKKKRSARARKARASLDALEELYQQVQRDDLSSLFSTAETHLGPVLGSPSIRETWKYRANPAKGQ